MTSSACVWHKSDDPIISVLLMMNIAQIIMKEFVRLELLRWASYTQGLLVQPEFSSFPPTILFINSLTPVLISRFLLNLRSVDRTVRAQGTTFAEDASLAVSTMRFNEHTNPNSQSKTDQFFGPMGVDLEDGTGYDRDVDGSLAADSESEGSGLSDSRLDGEVHKHEAIMVSHHGLGGKAVSEGVQEVRVVQ